MNGRNSTGGPAHRNEGDLDAMAAAYQSGNVFLGKLSIPIIDFRTYLEPELDMHHSFQSFSARLRMLRRQGNADTQVIWFSRDPYKPVDEAIDTLGRWLNNMRAHPDLSAATAKPAQISDRCYSNTGQLIASGDDVWDGVWNGKTDGDCMKAYPIFSNPRIVAGDDYAGDIFKCFLQPVDEAIANGVYAPLDLSDYREELSRVFPDGVCDYSLGDAARPSDLILN